MPTTTRYGMHTPLPDGSELVSVPQDIIGPLQTIDAELGIPVTTALPSNPASGKTVAISTDSYRSYFHNGTAPVSGGFIELLNSSGTFGSDIKLAASRKLIIGTDTNLYRSAADTLKTDDSFQVDGNVQVGGDLRLVAGGTTFRNKLSAASAAVANTVTETTVATMTIPANDAVVGAVYRIRAWGIASVTGIPTLTFRARIGANAIGSSGARTASTGITSHAWRVDAHITCLTTGGSGTGFGNVLTSETVSVAGAAGPLVPATILDGTASAVWATNASRDFTISVQWGTAAAANTATCQGFIAERVA